MERSYQHSEISISALTEHLLSLGVEPGDSVMVHASLRNIGPVENRGNGVVLALLQAIGERGNLVAYADFEPTEKIPYFDPKHSPASYDHGILTEIIRNWPGAVRSLNPGASTIAIGPLAEWICQNHPMNYGYGENSPFSKLLERKGKVLLLGSDLNNVSILHTAEHFAKIPNKRIIRREDKILSEGKVQSVIIEEFITNELVSDKMPEDYFSQITERYIASGFARTGLVGKANSFLLESRRFVDFAITKMETEYGQE